MARFIRSFFFIVLIIGCGSPSFAEGPVSISVGLGKLSGDTTYQIGGRVATDEGYWIQPDPTSELEFPLDVNMLTLNGEVSFAKHFSFNIGLNKNITSDAGKMKDSDWGILFMESQADYPNDPSQWAPVTLDVYSESDAELDGMIIDMNIEGILFKNRGWSFSAGVGYMYQNFDYDVSDTQQWYPSLGLYSDFVYGKVLTYEVEYSIPYFKGGVQYVNGLFSAEVSLGYSPKTDAEDKDVHLARDPVIVSKGDCDGTALMLCLKGSYSFSKQLFMTLQIDKTSIKTDGHMRFVDGALAAWIEEELESQQMLYSLSAGYSF